MAAGERLFISDELNMEPRQAHLEVNTYRAQGAHLLSEASVSALRTFHDKQLHRSETEIAEMFAVEAVAARERIEVIRAEAKKI